MKYNLFLHEPKISCFLKPLLVVSIPVFGCGPRSWSKVNIYKRYFDIQIKILYIMTAVLIVVINIYFILYFGMYL